MNNEQHVDDNDNGVLLEDGLDIKDLLNGGGCFNINSNFSNDSDFNLFPELETGADVDDDGTPLYEPIPSPWLLAFEDLRRLMRPLPAPNDAIFKRIVREGHTDLVAAPAGDNACGTGGAQQPHHLRLTIHYNFYFEQTDQPFDSTYLRTRPLVFITGQQSTLAGIELACLSMRCGEEAQFCIPSELLYGRLGCPPRIPPAADGLLVIHLLRSADVGDAEALERLAEEDQRRFAAVWPQAQAVYTRGLDAFKRQDFAMASRMFHKAVAGLEVCTMANEEEQERQQQFVVRLYTNLAVCYNKMVQPRRACLMATEVERLTRGTGGGGVPPATCCKALFQHGRALLQLGEFGRAEAKLLQAQRVQPTNRDISDELRLLARKKLEHQGRERELWQRAFGMREEVEAGKQAAAARERAAAADVDGLDATFRAMTVRCLEEFAANEETSTLQLPAGLTAVEVRCVEQMIADMRIKLEVRGGGATTQQQKTYTLRKMQSSV